MNAPADEVDRLLHRIESSLGILAVRRSGGAAMLPTEFARFSDRQIATMIARDAASLYAHYPEVAS